MKKPLNLAKAITALLICCGLSISAFAQNRAISGTVVDTQNVPIIGASVFVVGNTSIGAMTDIDGKFSLNVPANANINISCIGYATQVIPVANQTVFNVVLQEDAEFLEETVVIGYGVQRKSDVTGAIASVRSEDFANRSTSDPANALQGKAAGVQILNSGAPGSGSGIRVRGYSSNSGELGPLLIVDGLQVDNIQYLEPSMIESMEVLKDAASAAIYGAQAGNGVVLITTKSGSKNNDGRVTYSNQFVMSSLIHKSEVMNAEQYIENKMNGLLLNQSMLDNINYNGQDTDWQDIVFGPGSTIRHTLSVQGGNDRGNYFLSLSNTDEDGIVRDDKDSYSRLSAQINADYRIKKWLQVGTNNSIERWTRNSGGSGGSVLSSALINDPLTKPFLTYDELPVVSKDALRDGYRLFTNPEDPSLYFGVSEIYEAENGGHPLIARDQSVTENFGLNFRGTIYANLTPFKGFTFTSRFGYRANQSYSSSYTAPYFVNTHVKNETHNISAEINTGLYYQWENFANYNITIKKHNISAMAGMSYIENNSQSVSGSGTGSDPLTGYDSNFLYLNYLKSDASKSTSGVTNKSASIAYFGRIGWSYDNRYNFQANFRADAFDSSKLSKKARWGYFPSFSAGWTISNEKFMKGIDKSILSLLKVRASWGINGNVNVLRNYAYAADINYNAYFWEYKDEPVLSYGSAPGSLANPDLQWETSKQLDLGIDMRFLNNRLSISADYYNKQTEGLLLTITPPAEIGFSSTTINAGNVLNTGFELEANWKDQIGDFQYSISGNMAFLHNEITSLAPTIDRIGGHTVTGAHLQTACEVGMPIWFIRGYKYLGIDAEGNPVIDQSKGANPDKVEQDDIQPIGSGIPAVTYGITLSAAWKGFDLTVFGTGVGGADVYLGLYRTDRPLCNTFAVYHEESFDKKGAAAMYPKASTIASNNSFWSSSATVWDASFFKIKQIQLGYTLPESLTKKVAISNLRLYASLDDYFTFTKYPGLDPETATTGGGNQIGVDTGRYPISKKLIFGMNITF